MEQMSKDFQVFGANGYTVMPNFHLRDKNLSCKAKGLLSIMLSLPKEWDYSINGLVSLSSDGRDSIKNTLNELKHAEYVQIEEHRDANGHFKYKYKVYYLPYPKWLQISKLTEDAFTASVKPSPENPQEINTNNKILNNKKDKIDRIDRTQGFNPCEDIKHNILTKDLIKRGYISEDDTSSFLYDKLFQDLIDQGIDFHDLVTMTSYVIKNIKNRNFIDYDGNEIKNRYGYFKNSLMANVRRFYEMPDIESDDDFIDWLSGNEKEYDWLNDD